MSHREKPLRWYVITTVLVALCAPALAQNEPPPEKPSARERLIQIRDGQAGTPVENAIGRHPMSYDSELDLGFDLDTIRDHVKRAD